MKRSEMEANLFCIHCNDETPHMIIYINNEITKIECEDCRHIVELKVDIMKEFYKEIYERVSTKPSRITQEYKKDLNMFLSRLPIRVVSKPYRLIRELKESRKVIRQYRKR
ncbi:bh protein [Metabacillus arenae]|uniref:Bh protein n=1 Tax=Metabacillus arenae TaxID=2771434 RepID=A0A926NLC2_9BACI|nr:bh protein [Metabacillus arenae]MBD1383501.1 bh protein [Metabacillus arenae]